MMYLILYLQAISLISSYIDLVIKCLSISAYFVPDKSLRLLFNEDRRGTIRRVIGSKRRPKEP